MSRGILRTMDSTRGARCKGKTRTGADCRRTVPPGKPYCGICLGESGDAAEDASAATAAATSDLLASDDTPACPQTCECEDEDAPCKLMVCTRCGTCHCQKCQCSSRTPHSHSDLDDAHVVTAPSRGHDEAALSGQPIPDAGELTKWQARELGGLQAVTVGFLRTIHDIYMDKCAAVDTESECAFISERYAGLFDNIDAELLSRGIQSTVDLPTELRLIHDH